MKTETLSSTTSKFWEEAQHVINNLDSIPRDQKLIKTEERFKQYVTEHISEMIKVMAVVGRDQLVEDAIIDAINNCPKQIRYNFIASIMQILNKVKRRRKEGKL